MHKRRQVRDLRPGDKVLAGYRRGFAPIMPNASDYARRRLRIDYAVAFGTVEQVTKVDARCWRITVAGVPGFVDVAPWGTVLVAAD